MKCTVEIKFKIAGGQGAINIKLSSQPVQFKNGGRRQRNYLISRDVILQVIPLIIFESRVYETEILQVYKIFRYLKYKSLCHPR